MKELEKLLLILETRYNMYRVLSGVNDAEIPDPIFKQIEIEIDKIKSPKSLFDSTDRTQRRVAKRNRNNKPFYGG